MRTKHLKGEVTFTQLSRCALLFIHIWGCINDAVVSSNYTASNVD